MTILFFSTEEPKGSECLEKFVSMQECLSKYPELYEKESGGDGGDDAMAQLAQEGGAAANAKEGEEQAQGAEENTEGK